ncbi:MAG: hypothetical protein HUK08_08515, partial [Bacteroidaceae bacterium]|nr:hypothetical protein [Bacteroidaceae bacterium]
QLNNGNWSKLACAGNAALTDESSQVSYVITTSMLYEIQSGGLIVCGAGYTLTSVAINKGTVSGVENAVWIGESAIDWSEGVSKWVQVDAACFAWIKAGDVLRLNCKDVQSGAQGGILKSGDWTLLSGDSYKVINADDGYYEYTVTADMVSELKANGMIVSGIGYTLTSIDIYANVTISDAGISTLCLPFNATVPSGMSVYTLGTLSGDKITATKVESCSVIPAGEGVLIKGASGQQYTMYATSSAADNLGGNTLKGVTREATAGANDYAFTLKDGSAVFAKVASGTAIPSRKAYYSSVTSLGARQLGINMSDDGNTTAIEGVFGANAPNAGDSFEGNEVYSVSGCKVGADYKGIVIRNGKKYINK